MALKSNMPITRQKTSNKVKFKLMQLTKTNKIMLLMINPLLSKYSVNKIKADDRNILTIIKYKIYFIYIKNKLISKLNFLINNVKIIDKPIANIQLNIQLLNMLFKTFSFESTIPIVLCLK